jgi:hypothetical protein
VFQDDGPEKANSDVPGDVADDVPVAQETVQVIPGSKLLWRINSRPPNSAQVCYPSEAGPPTLLRSVTPLRLAPQLCSGLLPL